MLMKRERLVDRTILVNRDNPVPPDFPDSIEIVFVEVEKGFSVPLEKETAEKYLQLKSYLAELGIRIEVLSGYRYPETQKRIWRENVAAYGEEYAWQHVAKPGYSEHQTGLALDLSLYDEQNDKVEDTDVEAYEKLFPYLHEFGFILRYPAGREGVTGYRFEPWHIRYVGVKAARLIHRNDWTLEEYVSHVDKLNGGEE